MEELFILFEQNWFRENIIFPKNPDQENPEKCQNPQKMSQNNLVRSFSYQSLSSVGDEFSSKGNLSPVSVLPMTPKELQTILSGKEIEEKIQRQKQGSENRGFREKRRRNRRKKRRESKSLSELEFEELQGFMDLGFVFSEEDKDSSLASIIPGIQRLGKKQGNQDFGDCKYDNDCEDHDDSNNEGRVSRPYLSEAWEVLDTRKEVVKVNPMINWKIPINLISNEVDMKKHLRVWAHTVASVVR